MSAIYGIINKNGKPIEQATVNKLKQVLVHRATDGQGSIQDKNVAFGFCKLVVYPNQQNEQLPVETSDIIFTADARIDNRDELYSLLSLDKQQWQHEADSYLILKAYQHWGENCAKFLQGEFAFAIWDKIKQQLFLAADQIGFCPLFYYNGPDEFIFCTEIKGVAAAKTTPNYFDDEHVINNHFRQSDPAKTYNKEVWALGGGNTLSLQGNNLQKKKYWEFKPTGRYNFKRDEEWLDCMRHLLYRSIEKRLNTDVPVGVTLSGGLDSSSVACILSELLAKKNKPLYAFSSVLPVGHGGVEVDERRYIDIINKHCPNIIQTFVEAPGVGPFDNVGEAFDIEESIPNGFFYMDRAISSAAAQKNIRMIFNGFGGDFWISWPGGTVIYSLMQQGKYQAALRILRQLSQVNKISPLKLIRTDYLYYTAWWQQLRKLKRRETNWQEYTALQPTFLKDYNNDVLKSPFFNNKVVEMQKLVNTGFIGRLMGMFDNCSGAYGTASFQPLLDKDIMEFLAEIPMHLFNKNGYKRSLIRHAMQGILPPEIQWRMDKLPYNPDFARRAIDGKEKLMSLLDDADSAFVFDRYLSKDVIITHFDVIKPFAGFSSATSVTGIRMVQAGILIEALKHLKSIGYQFE